MSKKEFFHSTPYDVQQFVKFHDEQFKRKAEGEFEKLKYSAWLNGMYVRCAVASVLSRKAKYPKKPFGEKEEDENIVVTEDMSEEEKEEVRKKFTKNMMELFNVKDDGSVY